jgi:hypothetical protein
MIVSAENAAHVRRQVLDAVTLRFKRKFARFALLDALLGGASLALAFLVSLFALLPAPFLLTRCVMALALLWARGHVLGAYAQIAFHRESLMRRFAHASHMPIFAVWIATSHLFALLLGVVLLPLGAVLIVVSFTAGVLDAATALVAVTFTAGAIFYLHASERYAYECCVIASVDDVLRHTETRRAFVVSSAAQHNYRTERLFNQRNAAAVAAAPTASTSDATATNGASLVRVVAAGKRRGGRAGARLETQTTRSGEAPDAKHRAQKRQ